MTTTIVDPRSGTLVMFRHGRARPGELASGVRRRLVTVDRRPAMGERLVTVIVGPPMGKVVGRGATASLTRIGRASVMAAGSIPGRAHGIAGLPLVETTSGTAVGAIRGRAHKIGGRQLVGTTAGGWPATDARVRARAPSLGDGPTIGGRTVGAPSGIRVGTEIRIETGPAAEM